VQAGLDLLCDLDWLLVLKRETGGRPTFVYRINPRAVVWRKTSRGWRHKSRAALSSWTSNNAKKSGFW